MSKLCALFFKLISTGVLFFASTPTFSYVVKDTRGVVFEFSKTPRCATIVPAVTQNIFSIGAEDCLIANSKFCDYPEAAKKKIKIGGYIDPDYEKIVELKPDVVILPETKDDRVESRLRKLGVKCFFLNGEGLEFIARDIRLLGELTNKKNEAEKVALDFESNISSDTRNLKKRRALFMFGKMAAGKGSFVGDIMKACGLINCAETTGIAWAEISREFVLSARPEIIFVEIADDADRIRAEKYYRSDLIWRSTPAVKNSNVYFIPRSLVVVPSARVIDALKLMREYCSSAK